MKSLKILLLEDNVADAALVAHQLESAGLLFRLRSIETEAELRQAMEAETPDLILSDHGLPSFSGFKALQIVRATHPNLPFIFVSGSNDQGVVTKMYDEGATDYVYKRDIGDLKSAVLRALKPAPSETPVVLRPEKNFTMSVSRSQSPAASSIRARDSFDIARLW